MTEDERDYYEERAGIREFDGNQTREKAEAGALLDIENRRKRRDALMSEM
jgi:hypothetical protein